jgi:hypothetical protein
LNTIISGFVVGHTYTFRVVSNTVSGSSPSSEPSVPFFVPFIPTNPPVELMVTPRFDMSGTVDLTWTDPSWNPNTQGSGSYQGYFIQLYNGNTIEQKFSVPYIPDQSSNQIISDLQIGVEYNIQAESVYNYADTINVSIPVFTPFLLTVPGIVRDISANAIDTTTIAVSWSPPSYLGIPDNFIGYNLSCYLFEDPSYDVFSVSIPPEETSFTAGSLIPGKDYYFTINAVNISGMSQDTFSNVTTTYKVPDPPTNLVIDPSYDVPGTIQLSWSAPIFQGIPPLDGYWVTYDPNPITSLSPTVFSDNYYVDDNGNVKYYCDISNLEINIPYNYIINASNPYGYSQDLSFNYALSTPNPPFFIFANQIENNI